MYSKFDEFHTTHYIKMSSKHNYSMELIPGYLYNKYQTKWNYILTVIIILYKKARCMYTLNIYIIYCNKSIQNKTASNYCAFVTTVG